MIENDRIGNSNSFGIFVILVYKKKPARESMSFIVELFLAVCLGKHTKRAQKRIFGPFLSQKRTGATLHDVTSFWEIFKTRNNFLNLFFKCRNNASQNLSKRVVICFFGVWLMADGYRRTSHFAALLMCL